MGRRAGRATWLVCAGVAIVAAGVGIAAFVDRPEGGRERIATLEGGVDLHGGTNYSRFDAPSPTVCAEACLSDPRCRAFSFDTAARRCWLKADVPDKAKNARFISGVKSRG